MVLVHKTLEVASGASASSTDTYTSWIVLDRLSTPFNVGFGVHTSGAGTVVYAVEHTFEKPSSNTDNTVVKFTHIDVTAATDDADGNYAFPVVAIRCRATDSSGASTIDFFVNQAGP